MVVCIALGLALAGLFAGCETGAYSVHRLRLRVRAEEGRPDALRVRRLLADPQRLIVTTLVGNNLAGYLMAYVTTEEAVRLLGPAHAELAATLALTPLVWLVGELVPKELFRRRPDVLLYRASRFLRVWEVLLLPAVLVLLAYARALERLVHGGGRPVKEAFLTERRMAYYLSAGTQEGVLTQYQDEMARNVISLRQRSLRDVVIPLARVDMVKNTADGEAVLELARRKGHSRYPVYRRRRGHVVGVVNLHDLAYRERPGGPIKPITRDLMSLPPEMPVDDALMRMQASRYPMALVARGKKVVGIVTLKDLVEEIVGDLPGL
ncbi:MAG: DUF21 domain-containing protein [Planctomycetes bacterium]|nr:DUF21 domain-containing protein [Planctomycetota bacterium]